MPDLEKLRRFALIAAVLLILYSAAGIVLEPGAKMSFLGLPFMIESPNLLQFGLVLLCVYGLFRFFYYGVMLSDSPYRHRKDLLEKLHAEGGHGKYLGSTYFGPNKFTTTPMVHDRSEVETEVNCLSQAFPKVGKFRLNSKIESHHFCDDNGEDYHCWDADITIPMPCRIAALIHDIDYTAPIWANLLALGFAGYRLLQ